MKDLQAVARTLLEEQRVAGGDRLAGVAGWWDSRTRNSNRHRHKGTNMIKLAVIIGSTRPGRVGEAVAKWVYEIAAQRTEAQFELVDIKSFDLPRLDEPVPP